MTQAEQRSTLSEAIRKHKEFLFPAVATYYREPLAIVKCEGEQQSARGTFDPAYLNYTMGKLMIRKLRDDWCATRGGKAAWKQFHDTFVSHGGPPIPLVRNAMMGADDKGSLF